MEDKKTKTILIIDDNIDLVRVYREILTSEGFHVITASRAEEALKALESKEHTPNLILLDCLMPQMNGEEFILALQQKEPEFTKKCPIIGFSSFNQGNPLSQGLEKLATAYVQKPDDIEALLEIVNRYV